MQETNDTICAIATASGGALGIIRVSGEDAIAITSTIFHPAGGKDFNEAKARQATYGTIEHQGQIVDEVVAIAYRAPHSYTGENSVELTCHGSQYILSRITQLLILHGARLAQPGEYTRRAFLNGKMDLSQAEAVADVIAANSESYNRIAISQLRGGVRHMLDNLHGLILNLRSMMELELDFSDHDDLDFADRSQLLSQAQAIKDRMSAIAATFTSGNTIKNGIPVAIVGCPNVGKSTLMNALLKEDRAIVSDIPGTTRDTIEERLYIQGIEFRIIDTAGLRNTSDHVETMGINRTYDTMRRAQTIVCMIDAQNPDIRPALPVEHIPEGIPVIFAVNKTDLVSDPLQLQSLDAEINRLAAAMPGHKATILHLAAKKGQGIDNLKSALVKAQNLSALNTSDTIIVNRRHYEALSKANASMQRVIDGIKGNIPTELVSLDLRQVDFDLSEIGGATTSQSVLNNIFKNFCVGK